MNICRFII